MIYLENLPLNEYKFEDHQWFLFRDIFVRLRLLDGLMDNPSFLTTVVLNGSERADVIAHRLYGNSNLYWTLYLVNDIIDPSDWIKNEWCLDRYVKEKYENPFATSHHVNSKGEIGDQRANQWQIQRKPFGTENVEPENFHPVSFYQKEEESNERRRIVRAIRKEYMPQFLIDAETKLRGYHGE